MNGIVRYTGFDYPDPKKWAFEKPLFYLLPGKRNELVFNWNTTGAGYITTHGQYDYVAFYRTAALPVSYIPGQIGNSEVAETELEVMSAFEESGYEFFSSTGDPHLSRVVQYASLYTIFREFGIKSSIPSFSKVNLKTDTIDNMIAEKLNSLRNANDQKLLAFARETTAKFQDEEFDAFITELMPMFIELAKEFDSSNDATDEQIENAIRLSLNTKEGKREFIEFSANLLAIPLIEERDLLIKWYDKIGNDGMSDLALLLTKSQLTLTEQMILAMIRKQVSDESSIEAINDFLDKHEAQMTILLVLREKLKTSFWLNSKEIVAKVLELYEHASSKHQATGWIQTPSIVISSISGQANTIVGGHNINSKTITVRKTDQVPKSMPRVVDENGKRVIEINPEIASESWKLVRNAAKAKNPVEATHKIRQDLKNGIQTIQQDFSDALFFGKLPKGSHGANIESNAGYQHSNEPLSVETLKALESSEIISRDALLMKSTGKKMSIVNRHPHGELEAESMYELVNLVAEAIPQPGKSGTIQIIDTTMLTENQAFALQKNLELKLTNIIIANIRGGTNKFRKSLPTLIDDYDLTSANIKISNSKKISSGPRKGLYETEINIELPAEKQEIKSLPCKLRMFFKSQPDALRERIIPLIKRSFNRLEQKDNFIPHYKHELKWIEEQLDDAGMNTDIHMQINDMLFSKNIKPKYNDCYSKANCKAA